jgi:hypothetical protein
MEMKDFHSAAKAIELGGLEGLGKAAEIVGPKAAFALAVAHVRRNFGSMGMCPADPAIDEMVNHMTPAYQFALFCTGKWYCFDNSSAFSVKWRGEAYPTVEHAYQAAKFTDRHGNSIGEVGDTPEPMADLIRKATSVHEAKRLAHSFPFRISVREDWSEELKLEIMESLLRAKHAQHEYIREKLVQSRGALLVEDSDQDAFWGRGPNWDGRNHLGKLWMKIRDES